MNESCTCGPLAQWTENLRARTLWILILLLAVLPAAGIAAEDADDEPAAGDGGVDQEGTAFLSESAKRFTWGAEVKTHFRSSDDVTVGTPFSGVGGSPVVLATVDPGESFEVSTVSLFADARWGEVVHAHFKLDIIDLYERNPTSTDREVDVDEAWIRFGRETETGEMPARKSFYLKLGKLAHFERQDDRNLESYGLSTTTFNRLEDVGLELGFDLHRNVYVKASLTQGNPVFYRDPNALAGDTGATLLDPESARLGTGIGLIYDAEVEDISLDSNLEVGIGLGFRFGDAYGRRNLDVLFWDYERTLANAVDLEGATLQGDLALLRSIGGGQPLAITDDEKREWGINIHYVDGPLTFFGQYVDQELAGLPRRGFEAEVTWRFEMPLVWTVSEQQLFGSLTPVVRYSRLLVDFEHPPFTPLPSLAWDWYKLDVGLRVDILDGLDVTAEYAFNHGYLTDINEFLLTLRWRR